MNLLLCKIKPLFASFLILLSFLFLILGLAYLNYYVFGNVNLKTTCETKFNNSSKWMNGTCYYFHNDEVKSFDAAQKICSEKFKKYGFGNGILYEPKNLENFALIYELAENFSNHSTLQLWLGLNDQSIEGDFVYNSTGKLPIFTAPWAGNYSSLSENENKCETYFSIL